MVNSSQFPSLGVSTSPLCLWQVGLSTGDRLYRVKWGSSVLEPQPKSGEIPIAGWKIPV